MFVSIQITKVLTDRPGYCSNIEQTLFLVSPSVKQLHWNHNAALCETPAQAQRIDDLPSWRIHAIICPSNPRPPPEYAR
jgi:hypothetical protein